eukprot:TRINITY_DN35686_c0_g1_i1.p1 TRINITY_DN35686_c0_g1~~TRINITY_DN35686_c0_g1_i1.p1  ORF type:complete len:320 (-),score=74.63 TRINITY_DN35686_c0_g1_i1:62-1021(-)
MAMAIALSSAEGELSRTCAAILKDLKAAAEKELLAARADVKKREEALFRREQVIAAKEAEIARRERELQIKSQSSSSSSAALQLPLTPTPARASPTKSDQKEGNWGLSPLRSSRPQPQQSPVPSPIAESEDLLSGRPSPSSVATSHIDSPAPKPKPRPAGVPALQLGPQASPSASSLNGSSSSCQKQSQLGTPARSQFSPRQQRAQPQPFGMPLSSPRTPGMTNSRQQLSPKASPSVGTRELKAMFEERVAANSSPSVAPRSVRKTPGTASAIAAAASALQAAAAANSVSAAPELAASPPPAKLSLQDLLRLDEERRMK